MSEDLKLDDPVQIETENSPQPLQGVVAYLGPVSFSENANDWVGVRLTGTSVGRGKNDGSVKGKHYFDCAGANGGMFVKKSAVKKRVLTKLEELRLKRELKKGGSSSVSVGGSGGGERSSRRSMGGVPYAVGSSSAAAMGGDDASVVSMGSTISGRSSRSRLDEIRERRLALAAGGVSSRKTPSKPPSDTPSSNASSNNLGTPKPLKSTVRSSTASNPSSTPSTATQSSEQSLPSEDTRLLTEKVSTLSSKMNAQEDEIQSLRKSLQKAEQAARDANLAKEEAQSALSVINAQQQSQPSNVNDNNKDDNDETLKHLQVQLEQSQSEVTSLQSQLTNLQSQNESLTTNLKSTQTQLERTAQTLETERESKSTEHQHLQSQLLQTKSKLSAVETELATKTTQASNREKTDANHYKERAKLSSQLSSLQRRIEELNAEKMDHESAMEELALDKEHLEEKLEAAEEKLEEIKIDAESAQIEVDELRMELEDARGRAEAAESSLAIHKASASSDPNKDSANNLTNPNVPVSNTAANSTNADAEDVAQALSIQNSRLREAIVRLREQTSFEKVELHRQLRAAQKEAEQASDLQSKLEQLTQSHAKHREEIRDLKEMVDQGSALESMVEELSDRNLLLEDDIVLLNETIREMEENMEVNAEMEEAQAEEIKALMRDLEIRDTVILNLEEAIKMQRRRENDFQRTVGNYRTSIEKLKQEKNSLLALQQGGEGIKSDLIAASQKALAQAAQLVSDAAKARKKEAEAAFHFVDSQVKGHLASRLERLLPGTLVASEVATVKGELLLSKVAIKASLCLAGVKDIFSTAIHDGTHHLKELDNLVPVATKPQDTTLLSDALSQRIATMIHQAKFANLVVTASSDSIRLLAAGQWPDLLTVDASVELGNSVVHSIPPLDSALSEQLAMLKEEGGLSPHRSNLTALDQSVKKTQLEVFAASDEKGNPIVSSDWNPPGLQALKDVSLAKFSCLGVASILASVVTPTDDDAGSPLSVPLQSTVLSKSLSPVLTTMDQICTEASKACEQMNGLNVADGKVLSDVSNFASEWKSSSETMFGAVEAMFSVQKVMVARIAELIPLADATSKSLSKLSSCLRVAKVVHEEGIQFHPLSPETTDPWYGIAKIASKVRSIDGDEEDINYILRARALEQQLSVAVENDAKLSIANAKVVSLEKSLATRSKEISMQNSRLAELEQLLSQTSIAPAATISSPVKSSTPSEEVNTLKEEIRVLSEAMEVTQAQVDEYEREIRSLKDPQRARTPGKRGSQISRKSASLDADFSLASLGIGSSQKSKPISVANTLSLEAALFRPALRSAQSDAAMWKAKAVESKLHKLPPLSVASRRTKSQKDQKLADVCENLFLASSQLRLAKSSIKVVDLGKSNEVVRVGKHNSVTGRSSMARIQLREERYKTSVAMERLKEASSAAMHLLAGFSGTGNIVISSAAVSSISHNESPLGGDKMLGKVSISGTEPKRIIPLVVQKNDLQQFHSSLLQ